MPSTKKRFLQTNFEIKTAVKAITAKKTTTTTATNEANRKKSIK